MASSAAGEIRPMKRLRTKTTLKQDALGMEGGNVTIIANLISGAELATVRLNCTSTVGDLQARLMQAAALPSMYALQLVYRDSLLDPRKTLTESGLQDCSVVDAIKREGFVAAGTKAGSVHLLNLITGHTHKQWTCKHEVDALAFTGHDCILAASSSGFGSLSACCISTGRCTLVMEFDVEAQFRAFASDCTCIVSDDNCGKLCVWRLGNVNGQMRGEDVQKATRKSSESTWTVGRCSTMHIVCSPQGKQLASLSETITRGVAISDFESGRCLRSLRSRRSIATFVIGMAFSPDGSCLALLIIDDDHTQTDVFWIELWHVDGQKPFKVLEKRRAEKGWTYTSMTFSPDGEKLCVPLPGGNRGSTIYVWNVNQGNCDRSLQLNAYPCRCAYSTDGSLLVAGAGKIIRAWSASTWDEVCNMKLQRVPKPTWTSITDVKFMC